MSFSHLTLKPLPLALIFIALFFSGGRAAGQSSSNPGVDQNLGMNPGQTYHGDLENINLATGNLYIELHPVELPGRNGHNLDISLGYNSQIWHLANQVQNVADSQGQIGTITYWWWSTATDPLAQQHPAGWFGFGQWPGFLYDLQQLVYQTYISSVGYNPGYWRHEFCDTNFRLVMPDGGAHAFPGMRRNCYWDDQSTDPLPYPNVLVGDTDPGDPLWMRLNWSGPAILYSADGTRFGSGPNSEDPNGNNITQHVGLPLPPTFTDTLGRVVQLPFQPSQSQQPQNGTNPNSIIYVDSNGVQRTITLNYLMNSTTQGAFSNPPPATNNGAGTYSMSAMTCSASSPCQWQGRLSSLVLPNGLTYTFHYNNSFGELDQITYPSGGYTRYDYATFQHYVGPQSETPPAPWDYREVVAKHVCRAPVVPPGTLTYTAAGAVPGNTCPVPEDTTTYAPVINSNNYNTTNASTTVTDPLGNVTVVQFAGGTPPFETKRMIYDNANHLLRTIDTTYPTQSQNNPGNPAACPYKSRETTTLDNGMVTKTEWDYQVSARLYGLPAIVSYQVCTGNVVEKREFAYAQGSPGQLLRKTDTAWGYGTPGAPFNNRKTSETVYNGSGSLVTQTTYEYDNYTQSISASGAVQHDSAFGTNYTTRGNLTAVSRWRNTDNSWLTTRYQYDDAGNIVSSTDPLNHTTTYSFADSWGDTHCSPSSGSAAAYATSVTNALNQAVNTTYNSCSGTLASAKDVNNLTTTHTYEMMHRRTQSNFPDVGQDTACFSEVSGSTCYSASLPLTVTRTQKINSTLTKTSKTIADGLGRVTQSQLTSDPQGTVLTDTSYDALGRVATVSNPYRQGTDPTGSPGTTTYAYDALGRKTSETYPDGSVLTTAYCGPTTLVTDPTGRWRRSTIDALGRLVEVDEPNAPGATVASTGCPGTGEPIWVTSYTYDTLGNLTQVVQNGSRQRNFTFDSLSRLLTSSNPEVGAITYKYDSDTNCPSPNSFPTLLVSKTDARGIRTCYQYDALNRETVRNYSNGDPTVTTTYDQPNCLGLASCSNIGHRTSMTDAAGSEAWSYQVDAANSRSVRVNQRTTNSITKATTYILDFAGNTTQATYPTGRIVNYTFDSANRPSAVQDALNGVIYATDFQTPPSGCITGSVCYTPQGNFYALSIGQSTGFTGLNLTHIYNSRLQPLEFKASSTGGNAIDTSYSFVDPSTSKNAGHVYGITNNLDTTRSQNFSYDQLNRITSALTTSTYATSPARCWGETYSIDTWGNLQSIAATTNSNYTGCSQESGFTKTADGNNHLSGFSYDLSGNTQNDGVNSYTWDAESQLKSGGGVNYLYDGDGRRVAKVSSKLYWYDGGSEILAETDPSGNTTAEYIFFGGQRIAMLPAGGSPIYYVEDLLGTSRVITTNTGVVCYDADFYPYGGERSYTNTCPQNNYKFEGKERDTETGNDDFGARYYSNRFGRWLSADWSAVPVPVPYANLTNPQTLNLYSMVADDPESFADLDGHQEPPPEEKPEPTETRESLMEELEKDPLTRDLARSIREEELWREGLRISENARAEAEFWKAHPEGWDDPFTGECYAPRPGYRPGTKGDANHRRTAEEEADKMDPPGETEVKVQTPGGKKGFRKLDASNINKGGKDMVQVIRPNKNGTAPKRENDAAADIHGARGTKPRFVPVRPPNKRTCPGCEGPPKPKPPGNN
jgi:RHS repeat-associated protein